MTMRRAKVLDRDRGYKALLLMADAIARDKPAVYPGVVGQRATASHRGGGGSVVDIAVRHELGDPPKRLPKRSFIASTVDKNEREYRDFIARAFKSTVLYHTRTGIPWRAQNSVALKRLGLKVQGDIKKTIVAGIAPPLSKYTLARKGKGKTTPLIDTSHLISSISYEVRARR